MIMSSSAPPPSTVVGPTPFNQTIYAKLLSGGGGCAISGFITNPCDVIKIRNQQYGGAKYGSFLNTAKNIVAEEGLAGLFKGVKPTVLRESTYSSVRMGIYEPIKSLMLSATAGGDSSSSSSAPGGKKTPDPPWMKFASSFLSGAIGSAMFNPVDLVKVRFQSQLPDQPAPYDGKVIRAFATIFRERGIAGLYSGCPATTTRAAFLTSSQLGTYDVIKNNVLVPQFNFSKEANSTHFVASLITSVVACTFANPADVVKTRVMNDKEQKIGGSVAHFKNVLRNEGPSAFMKGWLASYFRLGPHTIISFVMIEKIRQMMGMATF